MTDQTTATTLESIADEVARLVAGTHADPHHLLGTHLVDGQWVVRAYRPEAHAMQVLVGGDRAVAAGVAMMKTHDAGVFEAVMPAPETVTYRLRAWYPHQEEALEFEDPYRFWPTVGELDLHLIGEGRHRDLWRVLGAHCRIHEDVAGTSFAVWAPNAASVRVVGDFNAWDGRIHPMRSLGSSGTWEIFLPGVGHGAYYKFEILTRDGYLTLKADPLAFATDVPPGTASIVTRSMYQWSDHDLATRSKGRAKPDQNRGDWLAQPISIYEVHLASWKRRPTDANRCLSYRELAADLPDYVAGMGFTHVELMPVAEHPFGGSWGYQVSSYYAPSARFGSPDDFRALVDALHARGLGVIVDWVPAHFPRDDWALARFDGTALYEHEDARKGSHEEWGTLVFNFGRNEVRNFLVSNAGYWFDEYHVDGLRVDGVASMLYLDYSRKAGEWIPNQYGGRENLEAVALLRELNEVVFADHPSAIMAAEESTAWPGVSRPASTGGLGFGFKWNMGWMHDTLDYFSKEPIHRRYHQHDLTFSLLYAYTENFILPLSHDEVAHGKGSLLAKMPGDRWQKAANLRALYAWMWAHPGKQLLFMGGEIAQSEEWKHDGSVDWHLLQYPEHAGMQELVRALNRCYQAEPALWECDFTPDGFSWIDASDVDSNVFSFLRHGRPDAAGNKRVLACVANLSPVPRPHYWVGLPKGGIWREILNTDASFFGGSGTGNAGAVGAQPEPRHGQSHSAEITLPPLAVLWLVPD